MKRDWLMDNIMTVAMELYRREEQGYSDTFLKQVASVLRENVRLIEKELKQRAA